ncbi:MAG: HEPN domain-containing protein [Chitinispirillales bacterium]|nr:HEPN domain-containing protein [Chitinispirillales bacterium]
MREVRFRYGRSGVFFRRWLYVVFMCQQAMEKLVKGLYNYYIGDDVPRIHNIVNLMESACG